MRLTLSGAAFVLCLLPLNAADRRFVGLTASGLEVEARVIAPDRTPAPTVVLMGGMAGQDASSFAVNQAIGEYEGLKKHPFRLIGIALANPSKVPLQFPPQGVAYRDNPESQELWRWIGLQGPDLVLITGQDSGLADAFSNNVVAGLGKIPARRLTAGVGILKEIPTSIPLSDAHREITRRQNRTPRQLGDELSKVYGHNFDQVTYIPGMALIGQIRLGHREEVERLAEPYLTGAKDSLGPRPTSLTLAGHLVFGELAAATKDPRYVALVRKAADQGFTASGEMKESMPYHDEMSDSVFMGTAILARAGALTGERKYFDMAARHLDFMDKLVLRQDGLYRHSPLTDAAWGRGNAFPALGLALTLSDFPADHPAYNRILASYRRLMTSVAKFQDDDGMWHEVIDEPGSYAETSATAMIAFAMSRGVHQGWLGMNYQGRVDRAWKAMLARISSDGAMLDVCESTNKQRTFKDYVNRAASSDRDDRGGGMAMLFANELASVQ